MKKTPVVPEDLRGVFAVPPLARQSDPRRSLDMAQSGLIVRHLVSGGLTRLIYGGNAFLYHLTLGEYEELLEWLTDFGDGLLVIPSIGPSYGRAMDQAKLLRRFQFPCAMALPCNDPAGALGLERGYREIADAAGAGLIIYLKDENNFGRDHDTGLDAVARLVDDGICCGIKYAVVREDPARDPYLESLLQRVDRKFVISGIGERPAVVHLRDWKLAGFTTGSGCLAPRLSRELFEACARCDFNESATLRSKFIALEDLRDAWGPARVLHAAVELAGIARTGEVTPFLSGLSDQQISELSSVARRLFDAERQP
jgi:dihydrodipicolinate synthase/N-acetylneuraminate lyase